MIHGHGVSANVREDEGKVHGIRAGKMQDVART